MVIDKELLAALAKAFGIDGLPAERQQETMEKIGEILMKAIMLHCLQELTDAQKDELDAITEKDPENMEAVFSYFERTLPNFGEIVTYEVESFRQDTLGVMDATK
jgi:hypothetical protein